MLGLWLLFRCCLSAAHRVPTPLVTLGPGTDFVKKLPIKKTNCFLGRPGPHSSSPHEHSLCWGTALRQEARYFIFLLLISLLFKRKIFDQVSLRKITHNLEGAVLWSWSKKP